MADELTFHNLMHVGKFLVLEADDKHVIHVDIMIDGIPQRVRCKSYEVVGWSSVTAEKEATT